jgi:hypothetical protein
MKNSRKYRKASFVMLSGAKHLLFFSCGAESRPFASFRVTDCVVAITVGFSATCRAAPYGGPDA